MTCSTCISYLTDEDENGNVVKFHYDRKVESSFCAVRDLFYTVEKGEQPGAMYEFDGGKND